MSQVPFKDVVATTIEEYPEEIDSKMLHDFSVKHSENHLEQVINNRPKYFDEIFWNDDYNFSKNALNEIKATAPDPITT